MTNDFLDGLRQKALQVIGGNAVPLAQAPKAGNPATIGDPPQPQDSAKPWWNIYGKIISDYQIGQEERARAGHHHNDAGDAMRHAEWSRRMATTNGPILAGLMGVGHEIIDSLPPIIPGGHWQPTSEAMMDFTNNAEGLNAAKEGRPVNPANLQVHPLAPQAAYARANQHYEDQSQDVGSYPPRGTSPERYDPERRYRPYR